MDTPASQEISVRRLTHVEMGVSSRKVSQAATRKKPRAVRCEVAQRLFVATYMKLGSISLACEELGIARRTFYRWKAADQEFAQSIAEAEVDMVDRAEGELYRRALRKSDAALIFFLKSKKPEIYDRPRMGSVGTQVTINAPSTTLHVDHLSDEELARTQRFINLLREKILALPAEPTDGGATR